MANETHIIQKLRLNIRLPNEKSANQIQNIISEYCRHELVKFLEEKLSNLSEGDAILRIDKLSLDIGDISLFRLQEELPIRMEEAWQKAWAYQQPEVLSKQQKSKSYFVNDPVEPQIITTQRVGQEYSLLQLFEYFIRWGNLPWWGNLQQYKNWDELIDSLLPEQEKQLRQLILELELANKPRVLTRFHQQLSPQTRQKLANISPPQTAKLLIEPLKTLFQEIGTEKGQLPKSESTVNLFTALVKPAFQTQYESLEVIQYYFQSASIPVWGNAKNFDELEDVWLKLMKIQPEKWWKTTQQIIKRNQSRKRLFKELSAKAIHLLIGDQSRKNEHFLLDIVSELNLIVSSSSLDKILSEHVIWEYIFNYLWQIKKKRLVKKSLVRSVFEQLLIEHKQAYERIIEKISPLITLRNTPILFQFWPEINKKQSPKRKRSNKISDLFESETEAEEKIKKSQKAFDFLLFFFEQGVYPWWAQTYTSQSIDELILHEDIIEQSSDEFKKVFRQLLDSGKAWNRMLIQLSENTLSYILQLFSPQLSGFVLTLNQALNLLKNEQQIQAQTGDEVTLQIELQKKWIWDSILRPIFEQPSSTKDIYSWTVLIISHLLDGQSTDANQFLIQLQKISQQAIKKGETRFYPLDDVLDSMIKAKTLETDIQERDNESSDAINEKVSDETEDDKLTIDKVEKTFDRTENITEKETTVEERGRPDSSLDMEMSGEEKLRDESLINKELKEEKIADQKIESKQEESEGDSFEDQTMANQTTLDDFSKKEIKETLADQSEQSNILEDEKVIPENEHIDTDRPIDLTIFFEDAMQKKIKSPEKIIQLIQNDKIRQKLSLSESDAIFKRILKRLRPEKADMIIKYLGGINDEILQQSNRDQIILSLSRMEEDQVPEVKESVTTSTPWRSKSKSFSDIEGDPIYIGNSGLVILWPYLGRYFEMLEMLENGGFINQESALRAVHLLQYLVTGRMETPEYELALNKILCNLAIDEPVSLGIEMTDREIEISDSLLNGIIQNWEMLSKGTSVETLRGTFLIRDGKLNDNSDHWHLQVDPAPFDMLLDTMPWGISIIKLSWMEKLLQVSWR